ncbi:MAG: ECF transporter S component [Clostridiales bacterium]|nr:ECF transporter S component [Clostridiales bacterium]PWL72356.1 MAG: ECF transporter S component [Clostridiales bacterium]
MPQTTHAKTLKLAQLAMLIAIEAIMTFLPIGFIMIPPVSITLLHIPVIIGAILMGPLYGGILGGSFGLFSLTKASFAATSPVDMMFSPFLSGAPIQSIVMCIIPRILLGVIAAYLFILFRKLTKNEVVSILIAALVATACHTVMVLGCLWLLFNSIALESGVTLAAVFGTVITLNGILEMLAAGVLATAVCKPLWAFQKKRRLA